MIDARKLASNFLLPISYFLLKYSWDSCWLCSFPSAVSGVYRFMMWRSERKFFICPLRWVFGDRGHVLPIFWRTDLHLWCNMPVCPRQKSEFWEIHHYHPECTLRSCESCLRFYIACISLTRALFQPRPSVQSLPAGLYNLSITQIFIII